MPQRTNDYQQLVYLIQKALAPAGAKVTESAMIPGQDTLREIDVFIETEVGPYSIKIAVEAKDYKRRLNVTEIEAVIGKYSGNGGLAVNQVVIVARRGFSEAAEKRAKDARIELLTLREAKQSDWSKLAPQKLSLRMQPHICRVDVVPPVSATPSGGDPLINGRILCKGHGHDHGSPSQWANWFLKTQVLPNCELLQQVYEETQRRGGQVIATIPFPFANHDIAYDGQTQRLEKLVFHVHFVNATGTGKWSTMQMDGPESGSRTVDHLDVTVAGKRIRTVFPDGPHSSRIVVRVDSAPAASCDTTEPTAPSTLTFSTIPAAQCPRHFEQATTSGSCTPSTIRQLPVSALRQNSRHPPVSSAGPKNGRNSPCPCGSGKKFKHCCLKNRGVS